MISPPHQLLLLCHTRTLDQNLPSTASLDDHILTLFLQSDHNLACISTSLRKLARLRMVTTFGLSTAVLSHSAGNTDVTDVSSLHLATFYDISVRSLAQLRSLAAQIAGRNLLARPLEMDIWHMRSASNEGTHRGNKGVSCIFRRKSGLGFGESEIENHSFGSAGLFVSSVRYNRVDAYG